MMVEVAEVGCHEECHVVLGAHDLCQVDVGFQEVGAAHVVLAAQEVGGAGAQDDLGSLQSQPSGQQTT